MLKPGLPAFSQAVGSGQVGDYFIYNLCYRSNIGGSGKGEEKKEENIAKLSSKRDDRICPSKYSSEPCRPLVAPQPSE